MGMEFVALDFETANRSHGSPCQVGLALVRDGRVEGTWGSLMHPPPTRHWFDAECVLVHGIAENDLAGQPTFSELWPEIVRRLGDRAVVAHNAAFDISVIRDATSLCGIDWPTLDFACSMLLARRHHDTAEHTLDVVAAAAGVPVEHHHDAIDDALTCARITLDMARRAHVDSLDDLLRVSGLTWGRLSPGHYEPTSPTRAPAVLDGDSAPTLF